VDSEVADGKDAVAVAVFVAAGLGETRVHIAGAAIDNRGTAHGAGGVGRATQRSIQDHG